MRVGEFCTREVVVAEGSTGIAEAARLMRTEHVGDIVIVERSRDGNRPVGIVTDRDLVVEVLATEIDPSSVTLADLPSRDLALAREDDDLLDTLERMRALGVRRMPVVNTDNSLEGILAVDDVLGVLDELTSNLARLVSREVAVEVKQRR